MAPVPTGPCQAAGSVGDGGWKPCGQQAEAVRYLQMDGWVVAMQICACHKELWDGDVHQEWLRVVLPA